MVPKYLKPAFAAKATDSIRFKGHDYPVHRDIMVIEFDLWADLAALKGEGEALIVEIDTVACITEDCVLVLLDRVYNQSSVLTIDANVHPIVNLGVMNITQFLQTREHVYGMSFDVERMIKNTFEKDGTTGYWRWEAKSYSDYDQFHEDIDIFQAIDVAGIIIKDVEEYKVAPWIRLANSIALMRSIVGGSIPSATHHVIAFSEACLSFLSKKKPAWADVPVVKPDEGSLVARFDAKGCEFYRTFSSTPYKNHVPLRKTPKHYGFGSAAFYAATTSGSDVDVAGMAHGDVDAWKTCFDVVAKYKCDTRPTFKRKREGLGRA